MEVVPLETNHVQNSDKEVFLRDGGLTEMQGKRRKKRRGETYKD